MRSITKNEMSIALAIFRDTDNDYNANNMSKKIGISSMGALKILKRLESSSILKSKQFGKAVFYKVDLNSSYARAYIMFLLKKEAEETIPRIKRWVKELRKLKGAEIGILFGSVLKKEKFNDVDLLVVLKSAQNKTLNRSISEMNEINIKKIHAVKQTRQDLISNLEKKNDIILSIIKNSIVLFGYEEIVGVIKDVTCAR